MEHFFNTEKSEWYSNADTEIAELHREWVSL